MPAEQETTPPLSQLIRIPTKTLESAFIDEFFIIENV